MGHAAGLFFSSDTEKQTLYRRIVPSEEQYADQQERWNELADYLRPTLRDVTGYTTRTWLQGSYKFGTQIRPVRANEEFDIDLGFYFEWEGDSSEGRYAPLALKEQVQESLLTYAKTNKAVKEVAKPKTRCARVHYTNSFHIDVPAYHLNSKDQRALATEENEWELSDPKALYLWFRDQFDDGERAKVRRHIRYLKAWAALKFKSVDDRPSSILLTVLLALAQVIHDRILSDNDVQNPVNRAEKFGARLDNDQWDDLKVKFESLCDIAELADEAADEMSAADVWQEAFEYLLPMPIDTPVVETFARSVPALRFTPEIIVTAVSRTNRHLKFTDSNRVGPIPKGCDITFRIANATQMPLGAEVYWVVRNEGREAENSNDLGHTQGKGLSAQEYSAYRGRHHMDCTVRQFGTAIAFRRVPVEISGLDAPRRNPIQRPSWVTFRK